MISLSSGEVESYAESACAAKLLGLAELAKELRCTVSVSYETDSQFLFARTDDHRYKEWRLHTSSWTDPGWPKRPNRPACGGCAHKNSPGVFAGSDQGGSPRAPPSLRELPGRNPSATKTTDRFLHRT